MAAILWRIGAHNEVSGEKEDPHFGESQDTPCNVRHLAEVQREPNELVDGLGLQTASKQGGGIAKHRPLVVWVPSEDWGREV